jgi:hypothetical protein
LTISGADKPRYVELVMAFEEEFAARFRTDAGKTILTSATR